MPTQTEILQFIVETQGNDELAATAKALYDIAQGGGEAAPKAAALLDELGRLADVSSKTSGLPALKAQLQSVGDQLYTARVRAAELQTEFAATLEPTAALTRNYQKAQAAVAGLESQQTRLSVAITTSENALAAAGISTENLDAADRALQGQLAATRAEAIGLATGLKQAAVAGEAEAASLSEIAERNAVLRAGFEQLKTLLGTFAGIFAFEKLKEEVDDVLSTGSKFEQWGVEFKNAFGSAEAGAAALEKVKEIAEAVPLSLDDVTRAALQAKKEGLDIYDGSLQAIIATAVKFGGGAAEVSELLTTLGKSANQGGLSIRTLTTLEQQGIPAAALLGAAMGKTAEQVTALAKSGKLGSDSVATLIQELGKTSGNGLADEMGTLSAQVTKAHDNWDAFLQLIASSGVYDYVRTQIQSLNQSFKDGLESGRLQETARSISDGLIALGRTLVSLTEFVANNGSTIATVAEQYALFKGVMLGLDLLGAAQRFIGLAEATTAAGVAAEVAAAENGGFGKLRTAINKIPRSVAIGISVTGVIEGIEGILKLNEAAGGYLELNNQVLAQLKEDAALRTRLLTLADQTAQRTVAAANTQIASAEQLAQKNKEQSAAYVKSLGDAIRYYESIKVQDEAIGNSVGAQAASNKVKDLSIALQEATKHYGEINLALTKSGDLAASVASRFFDVTLHALSAAQAVQGIFDHIQFNDPNAFASVVALIDSVRTHSKDAGTAIKSELVEALTKLNAEDLSDFQAKVSQKLLEAKGNADALKIALGASLEAELEKLGLSAEQAGAQFTKAGQEIVTAFTGIVTNAQASGQQIQLAFASALSKVTTSGEVQALESQLQLAFAAGRISADQLAAAMEAAGRKTADIRTAAIEAGASLDGMGTQGSTAAQNISNALQDAKDRLVLQADEMARAIGKALQQDGNAEELKAQLKAVEAQIASLNKQIENTGTTAPPNLGKVAQGTRQITDTTVDAKKAVDAATAAAEKGYTEWGDATDAASLATKKITADTSHANDAMAALTQGIANARAGFLAVSAAAAQFYDLTLKAAFDAGHTDDGAGFDRVARAMQEALDVTTTKIANQRTEIASEVATINELGTASHQSLGSFGEDAEKASAKMSALADLIKEGKYQAGLLGQADLAPLQQALEAAAQRAQQLAQQTRQDIDAFNQLAQSAQDALDQEEGNQGSLEDRRHQKTLKDLQDAAKAAGKLNSDTYLQAVADENKLHELKLQHIREQQDAQNNSGSSSSGSSPSKSSATKGNGGIGSGASGSGAGGAAIGGLAPIHIHIDGQKQDATLLGDDDAARLLTSILRAKANSI